MTCPVVRCFALSLYALAACLSHHALGQARSIPFHITGQVVSSRDGSPVARCRIWARLPPTTAQTAGFGSRRDGTLPPENTVEADGSGRFNLDLPSAGRWQLTASATGFRRQAYLQHGDLSSAVVLTPAAPESHLLFRVDPDAIVTGIVLDEAAEPVRGASVDLSATRAPGVELQPSSGRGRLTARTDDLGRYEIAAVSPADYHLCVTAQPWYAAAAQSGTGSPGNSALTSDPSLDLVYPLTCFPGGDDPATADVLSVHAGEVREADFALSPLPSIHLRVNASLLAEAGADGSGSTNQHALAIPRISRLGPDGFTPVAALGTVGPDRQINIGGLTPGVFRIESRGSTGQTEQVSFLRLPGGSQTSFDRGAAVDAARVRLRLTGVEDPSRIDVVLIDPATGITFRADNSQRGFRRRQPSEGADDRVIPVPEGRYEVVLSAGGQDVFLRGLTLNGVHSSGRLVDVRRGENLALLDVATGRASVTGVAALNGKPAVGALVLLVPTTFGDPSAIPVLRRDQTNTDGSFDLSGVIPGQYILAVIDHGWSVNWRSPSILERFLLQGFPLTLKGGDALHQDATVQIP